MVRLVCKKTLMPGRECALTAACRTVKGVHPALILVVVTAEDGVGLWKRDSGCIGNVLGWSDFAPFRRSERQQQICSANAKKKCDEIWSTAAALRN